MKKVLTLLTGPGFVVAFGSVAFAFPPNPGYTQYYQVQNGTDRSVVVQFTNQSCVSPKRGTTLGAGKTFKFSCQTYGPAPVTDQATVARSLSTLPSSQCQFSLAGPVMTQNADGKEGFTCSLTSSDNHVTISVNPTAAMSSKYN